MHNSYCILLICWLDNYIFVVAKFLHRASFLGGQVVLKGIPKGGPVVVMKLSTHNHGFQVGGPGGHCHLDLDLKFKCLNGFEVTIGFNDM